MWEENIRTQQQRSQKYILKVLFEVQFVHIHQDHKTTFSHLIKVGLFFLLLWPDKDIPALFFKLHCLSIFEK